MLRLFFLFAHGAGDVAERNGSIVGLGPCAGAEKDSADGEDHSPVKLLAQGPRLDHANEFLLRLQREPAEEAFRGEADLLINCSGEKARAERRRHERRC